MANYSGFGAGNAAASPGRTIAIVHGGTGVRPKLYDFVLSSDGTPADNAFVWKVMRASTAGTDTAFTPTLVDPTDPKAATATFGQNASAEATFTANSEVFDTALNMRATFRWVCAPGGELVVSVAANAGLGFRCQHASSTASNRAQVYWSE